MSMSPILELDQLDGQCGGAAHGGAAARQRQHSRLRVHELSFPDCAVCACAAALCAHVRSRQVYIIIISKLVYFHQTVLQACFIL